MLVFVSCVIHLFGIEGNYLLFGVACFCVDGFSEVREVRLIFLDFFLVGNWMRFESLFA